MLNKITGERPQPVIEDEPVDLSHNPAAIELCEEVERFATETRIGMLSKALAVSREQCNNLISSQNVLLAEQTQQVKNLEWSNKKLVSELRSAVWNVSQEVKEENQKFSKDLNQTLEKISKTVTGIEHQVSTATERATDSATKTLNERVNKAADDAVFKMNQQAQSLTQKVRETEKEIEKAKDEIRFESGFRKFFFWATPVLVLAQAVVSVLLLLK